MEEQPRLFDPGPEVPQPPVYPHELLAITDRLVDLGCIPLAVNMLKMHDVYESSIADARRVIEVHEERIAKEGTNGTEH